MKSKHRNAPALAVCVAAIHAIGVTGPANAATAADGDRQPNLLAASSSNILSPETAPIIVIHIGAHRLVVIPRHIGDATTINAATIANKANSATLQNIITSTVAGAASAPSGEFHVRGSHGQYTYYLDGAPLPASVSGSFADLIDPKDIETLRVYTGGFPAKYGDNLAAVFDVTAKAGHVGRPGGYLQQGVEQNSTFETDSQIGGSIDRLSYFVSGIRSSTNRRLDPKTQDPLHDAGNESVLFGKFDYQLGAGKRLILDAAHNDAFFQLPNDADRQAVGQDDTQRENGSIGNLILREDQGKRHVVVALYSHNSRLRYSPSAADLLPAGDPDLASAVEDQSTNYVGLRTDLSLPAGNRHQLGLGFDVDAAAAHEKFVYRVPNASNPSSIDTFNEDQAISGGDRAVYIQDDWTPGRWLINYGTRYDIHKADTETSQLSPRLNLTYTADGRDKFHAYYNRLFQPASIEDVRKIDPTAAPFKPERDDFYEVGWQHDSGKVNTSISAYYKTEKDVIDENILTGTTIREPFNIEKGYVRGIELSIGGSLSPTISFYANYARSWARAAGNTTGGFNTPQTVVGYFYDDHDQTHTASLGVAYDHHGAFASLDGEYGSGFPFGETDNANGDPIAINFQRVSPHFIFNLAAGRKFGSSQVAFTVDNILNHAYVIKQAGPFTDTEWGQARTLGMKYTLNY